MTPQEIWNATKTQLELQFDRPTFDTWVKGASFLEYIADDDVYVISVPSSYVQERLQSRLYRNLRHILNNISGTASHLRFEVVKRQETANMLDEDMPLFKFLRHQIPPEEEAPSLPEVIRTPRLDDLPNNDLNPKYTFERFITNRSNQMVYEASRAVVDYPGTTYNPLLIYGASGIGKTHLLQAMAHEYVKRGLKTLYVPSEVFTSELMTAIRNRTQAMFQQKYRTVDVLLVDDIQFIAGKESTQEEFFHTFNALVQFNRQIIMVSDRHPRDIATLDDRLRSRFSGGLVADISQPEYETRRLIVEMWAQERQVNLTSEMIERIVSQASQDIRSLEGMFLQVVAQARMSNGQLTMPKVERTIERYHAPREYLTLPKIIEMTAQKFGVSVADITSKKRTDLVNTARQVAMYMARELTDFSLAQIGEAFGRNHTTVLHGYNKVSSDLTTNPTLRANVDKLKKSLGGA